MQFRRDIGRKALASALAPEQPAHAPPHHGITGV
jgi:hypothetical protein